MTANAPAIVEKDGIRKFGDAAIQDQLDVLYSRIPAGGKALELGVTLNEEKDVAVFAVAKLGAGWSIMGGLNKRWKKPVTAQVMVGKVLF